MKKTILLLLVSILSVNIMAQTEKSSKETKSKNVAESQLISAKSELNQTIELPKPSVTRNCDIMQALSERKSTREMVAEHISLQDLSDILWAAVGINRESEGKMTSPTARNSQDIEVYLCRPQGVYLYNNQKHILEMVSDVDLLNLLEISRATGAKDMLLIVADMAKYKDYHPKGDNKHFYEMGAVDAGIVSQNISLMCAAANIATVPRAMMVHKDIQKILEFGTNKVIWLNHPLGYFVK